MRRFAITAATLLVVLVVLIAVGVGNAMRDPVIVRYAVAVPGLTTPLRVVLLSDTHVVEPDMPPSRLARIVAQANSLRPDLTVLIGDYVSDKFLGSAVTSAAAVAPLAGLRARYGIFAVPGNHDHWRGIEGVVAGFGRAGIPLLANASRDVGPVIVAGLDDEFTGHSDIAAALGGINADTDPVILLTHSPDVFPDVPAQVAITLAGHTHGGQIKLPVIGTLTTASRFGRRYARGMVVEGGRTLIVSSGLGTSVLPMRFGVPPEIVVVTLKPSEAPRVVQSRR